MKIIHLSTSHTGGAGIAAGILNSKLVEIGVESRLVTLKKRNLESGSSTTLFERAFYSRALSLLISRFNLIFSKSSFFSLFSANLVSAKFISQFGSPSETVIHVHNYYNFISTKKINQLCRIGYKVVITMHDQRLMTGGCHSTLNCKEFISGCMVCPNLPLIANRIPKLNFHRMHESNFHSNNLVVITPSLWLKSQAMTSGLTKNFDIQHIPNVIYSRKNSGPRRTNNLLRIGIASVDPKSELKGGKIIQSLLETNSKQSTPLFEFVFMNESKFNQNKKYDFWEEIDLLFVPSLHDNSPNVIHEAKSFGIPVLASKVGGVTEMIFDKFDLGFDPRAVTIPELLAAIESFKNRTFSELEVVAMQEGFEKYLDNPLERHLRLYSSMIKSSN